MRQPAAPSPARFRATARRFLLALAERVPLNHAIWRASEAAVLADVTMERPILDIGCGDGVFARMLFDQPVDGPDLSISRLTRARETGAYRELKIASATNLPYPPASFATVFSNCVLEHIPDVDAVCREAARVLRPGGRFVFTVPTDRFGEFLLYPTLAGRLGAAWLGQGYVGVINRVFAHYHTDSPERWHRRLAEAGLETEAIWQVMPRPLTAVWDLLMPFATFQLIARRLLPWWPFPLQRLMLSSVSDPLADLMRPAGQPGANMVVVARKPVL